MNPNEDSFSLARALAIWHSVVWLGEIISWTVVDEVLYVRGQAGKSIGGFEEGM